MSDLRKFADKDYRDGFLHTTVRGWVAYQVQALREKLEMTQADFAARVGTTQSVISRMESDKAAPNVQTLLDMASELGVALLVQFVSYPEFLARTADMSIDALQPETIDESLRAPSKPQAALLAGLWRTHNQRTASHDLHRLMLQGAQEPRRARRDEPLAWPSAGQKPQPTGNEMRMI